MAKAAREPTHDDAERPSARSQPGDGAARNPIAQAARDTVAAAGGGRLQQRKEARKVMREAGVPTTKAGREAAAAQEADRAARAAKKRT